MMNKYIISPEKLSIAKNKIRIMGIEAELECPKNAIYIMKGGRLLLKKLLIENGAYEIPECVDDLYREEDGFCPETFKNCKAVEITNHSPTIDFYGAFYRCENLTELKLTSSVPTQTSDLSGFAENCSNLKSVTIDFNTENVTRMDRMFAYCEKLEKVDLKLNTKNVTSMNRMFSYCELKQITLDFDTRNLKEMSRMFENCTVLREIDISSFTIPERTNLALLVEGCDKLERVLMNAAPADK